jgi:hypothetical protein
MAVEMDDTTEPGLSQGRGRGPLTRPADDVDIFAALVKGDGRSGVAARPNALRRFRKRLSCGMRAVWDSAGVRPMLARVRRSWREAAGRLAR